MPAPLANESQLLAFAGSFLLVNVLPPLPGSPFQVCVLESLRTKIVSVFPILKVRICSTLFSVASPIWMNTGDSKFPLQFTMGSLRVESIVATSNSVYCIA
jgi:hypothetical protein